MAIGKLLFVGLGISGEEGISLAALSALKKCRKIYAEGYTNLLPEGALKRLEGLAGKKITLLSREQVEGEKELLQSASRLQTALVVPGDPLIATTHISLVIAAKKQAIPVEIHHASSILSAAMGESGLQAYKFGKTATLAYWRENYRPLAAYDAVRENLLRGLHTLLLLDIDEKLGPMSPSSAARTLLDMEASSKGGIFSPETKVVLLQGAGRDGRILGYLPLSRLLQMRLQGSPAVLIVPGALHFLEKEYLESL